MGDKKHVAQFIGRIYEVALSGAFDDGMFHPDSFRRGIGCALKHMKTYCPELVSDFSMLDQLVQDVDELEAELQAQATYQPDPNTADDPEFFDVTATEGTVTGALPWEDGGQT